jgi:uncharacterized membrane protein YeaQ/YmgE (transglycosylase-associated protein family)
MYTRPHLVAENKDMLHWIWVILIGLVIGVVAKLVMPGKDPGGIIVTMLLGIVGSIVATWLGRAVGLYQEGQSAGFIMSVAGAVLLLALYRIIAKRRSP